MFIQLCVQGKRNKKVEPWHICISTETNILRICYATGLFKLMLSTFQYVFKGQAGAKVFNIVWLKVLDFEA